MIISKLHPPLFFLFSNNTLCEQSEIFLFNIYHCLLILNFISYKRKTFAWFAAHLSSSWTDSSTYCRMLLVIWKRLPSVFYVLPQRLHWGIFLLTLVALDEKPMVWGIWIRRDGNHCPPVPAALRTLPHIPMLRPTFHYISQGIVCLSTYIEGINLRLRCSGEGSSLRIYTSCTRYNHSDTFSNHSTISSLSNRNPGDIFKNHWKYLKEHIISWC